MIYRVKFEHGYHELNFDFSKDNVSGGRPEEIALQFMTLAADTHVIDKDDDPPRPLKVTLEAIPDDKEDDF